VSAFVGRHGSMKPAGRVRNMVSGIEGRHALCESKERGWTEPNSVTAMNK
jgi:hypothetical protein